MAGLKERFGGVITTRLVAGGRGVFDVVAAGKRVFSKHAEHRFPDPGEVEDALAKMMGASA